MPYRLTAFALASLLVVSTLAYAQSQETQTQAPAVQKKPPPKARQAEKAPTRQQARRAFVVEVVRTAAALVQPDPQDRLRVLASAASIAAIVDRPMAAAFGREGARLESELIAGGTRPAVSVLASGFADCAVAAEFVAMLLPASVVIAEESLMGAISSCPRETMEPARMKLEAALQDGVLAPRPLMVLMESEGYKSQWSQTQFKAMFSSLPGARKRGDALSFAAMYMRAAPEVGAEPARDAGVRFLEWLNKMDAGGERNLAVNIVTDAMQDVLGEEGYQEALRSSATALSVAQTAGQSGELEQEEYEFVSVLEAMGQRGSDQTELIASLPPSRRAREAAAHGFATGTEGNMELAERYFDTAFSALNEVWAQRSEQQNAPAVIEEVSEAAAHVNPVDALARAQNLQDATAQAIGMLAVARVVVGLP